MLTKKQLLWLEKRVMLSSVQQSVYIFPITNKLQKPFCLKCPKENCFIIGFYIIANCYDFNLTTNKSVKKLSTIKPALHMHILIDSNQSKCIINKFEKHRGGGLLCTSEIENLLNQVYICFHSAKWQLSILCCHHI